MDGRREERAFPDAICAGLKENPRQFKAHEARNAELKMGYGEPTRSAVDSGLRPPDEKRADCEARGEGEENYIREKQREMSHALHLVCDRNAKCTPEEWEAAFSANTHMTYDISLTPSSLVNAVQSR